MARKLMWDYDVVDLVKTYGDKAISKAVESKYNKNIPLGDVYKDLKIYGGKLTPKQKEKVEKLLDKYYYKWLFAQTDKLLEEV